jgi:hypothetical protein
MRFINFTVFNSVSDMARNVISQKSLIPNYKAKIIVGECQIHHDEMLPPLHVLRVWKNDNYFRIDRNPLESRKSIGALEYSVNKRRFKIEFLHVFDGNKGSLNADPKYVHAREYIKAMISIAERKAIESKHDRIIMDTHNSLRLFDRYYKNEGFVLTNKVSTDHRAWVETQKILN